jgi:hypothetical protein
MKLNWDHEELRIGSKVGVQIDRQSEMTEGTLIERIGIGVALRLHLRANPNEPVVLASDADDLWRIRMNDGLEVTKPAFAIPLIVPEDSAAAA